MKSRGGKSQREEKKKEDQGRGTVRRQKMQVSEKVAKSQNTVFFHVFPMICGSGGSKSRLAKAAGAEPSGQMRNENCTLLWHEAHFQIKMLKAQQLHYNYNYNYTTLH